MRPIDLRSDTVTRPTDGMRQAMMTAPVGDDVYEDDPTVRCLEKLAAERMGKDAGLFVPSGTMGNLLAVLAHCERGSEIILGGLSHLFQYEGGSTAWVAGTQSRIVANEIDGTLSLDALEKAIREDDIHEPATRLLCLENTHNRCGGQPLAPEYCDRVGALAGDHGLLVHLDGARIFNAAVALGVEPMALTRSVDSVMFCLSKGLGAPIGSVLCGSREFIARARRLRKAIGGGMRQVGILAAAGIYALEHNVDRLAEDHANARALAEGIDAIPGLRCGPERIAQPVETNMVYFHIDEERYGVSGTTADVLEQRLKDRGVLAHREGKDPQQMRMATHLGVESADIPVAVSALRDALAVE
jgi:threonine aldolase